MKKSLIHVIVFILLILVVGEILFFVFDKDDIQGTEETRDDESWEQTVIFEGKTYRLNKNIYPLLFLGVDKTATIESEDEIANNGRADSVILLLFNEEEETITMLSIPRDTLMQIEFYSGGGEYLYSGDAQINMQYAVGEDDRSSCSLMRKRVSDLLYGIDVNQSLALTLDGMKIVVDEIGGVPITFEDDWTDINPDYKKGTTVTLDGTEAEKFVRRRDVEQIGSNEDRVNRQGEFVQAFMKKMETQNLSLGRLTEISEALGDNMKTNMDTDTMEKYLSYQMTEEEYTLPGETRGPTVTGYDEYIIDEDAWKKMVISLFYEEAD